MAGHSKWSDTKRKASKAKSDKPKEKWLPVGNRVMDRAWLRDKKSGIIYTGEALSLAVLVHAKGKRRDRDHEREVAKLLDDPNQKR